VWRNAEIALARAKGFGAGQVEMFEPGQAESGGDAAGGATVAGPRSAEDAAIEPEPEPEPGPGPVASAVGEAAETPAGAGA
jgi:hypothetical protein